MCTEFHTHTKGKRAALIAQDVPRNKIIVGLPLYGRQWSEVERGSDQTPGVYQNGVAGAGEWEKGNLGYNCLMGETFSEQKDASTCQAYDDLAQQYTYILVNDNGTLKSMSNNGLVNCYGYSVDGRTYGFDQIIESYYYNPTTQVFITYDSATMVQIKGQWIKNEGLGGGMFWDTSGDAPLAKGSQDVSLIDRLSQQFSQN